MPTTPRAFQDAHCSPCVVWLRVHGGRWVRLGNFDRNGAVRLVQYALDLLATRIQRNPFLRPGLRGTHAYQKLRNLLTGNILRL